LQFFGILIRREQYLAMFHHIIVTSRHTVWLKESQQEKVSPRQKQTEGWAASDVVNRSLIMDPSIAPPGFNLCRRLWSMLNHFRTGQDQCAANLGRWYQASNPSCSSGAPSQTVSHIVNDCPDTKFPAVCQPYIWLN